MHHRLIGPRTSATALALFFSFFFLVAGARAEVVGRDILIKGPDKGSAVYYLAYDGKRYVFPNENTYRTWFSDFSGVVSVSATDVATFPIGGNVTYRPGMKMVKITTDPKVYAVDQGGVLRWVQSEALAAALYGSDWNKKIDDVPDAFFFSYFLGTPIALSSDFKPSTVAQSTDTINKDKSIVMSANPRRSDTSLAGTVPSATLAITSFVIPSVAGAVGFISETAATVNITVPYGTSRTSLVPSIIFTGASVSPASSAAQDFTHPVTYRLTSSTGLTRSYVVTVEVEPQSSKKSISSFSFINLAGSDGDIDETAKTIAVTVPHGTILTSLAPTLVHNGKSVSPASGVSRNFSSPVTYTVTAEDASKRSYVVTVTVAPAADAKSITEFSFVNLATGVINESAKTIAVTVPNGTSPASLKPTIVHTGASVSPASGSSRNFTSPVTYTVTARDGSHQAYVVSVTVSPYHSSKAITSFSFPSLDGAVGVIDKSAMTITVTVPYGTSRSSLAPTIVHTGASVSPASGASRNFSSPVTYTVTAEDGTTQSYRVTVSVSSYSSVKAITSFRFYNLSGAIGVIDESAKTIAVTVPHGTDRSSLLPTVVYSGASMSPASDISRNFSSPVTYRVTAEDGTTKTYVVTVTVAP
jgi:hypothetical protein